MFSSSYSYVGFGVHIVRFSKVATIITPCAFTPTHIPDRKKEIFVLLLTDIKRVVSLSKVASWSDKQMLL